MGEAGRRGVVGPDQRAGAMSAPQCPVGRGGACVLVTEWGRSGASGPEPYRDAWQRVLVRAVLSQTRRRGLVLDRLETRALLWAAGRMRR